MRHAIRRYVNDHAWRATTKLRRGIENGKVVFDYPAHLPLYRQAQICARQSIDLDRVAST
jgi:transposase